jgi:hypothetical protein
LHIGGPALAKETHVVHRLVVAATLLSGLIVPFAALAQSAPPVTVVVTTQKVPLPPPLTAEQHGAAITAAQNAMFALANQTRKTHGDKRQNWPPDAEKAVADAEDAFTTASMRGWYERPETQLGLDDSVQDLLRSAASSKIIQVSATNTAGAMLVVSITHRRSASNTDVTGDRYFIRFRLTHGGGMTDEQFLERTLGYSWNRLSSKLIARPKDGSGYVELEAGSPASYKNCAATIQGIVQNFVRQRLTADTSKK